MNEKQGRKAVGANLHVPDLSSAGLIVMNFAVNIILAEELFELFVRPAELDILIDQKAGADKQRQENDHNP